MNAKAAALFAVLACLLPFAGCGGDSNSSISAAEYKTKANEICRETVSEWKGLLLKETAAHPNASTLPEKKRMEIAATRIFLPPLEHLVASFSTLEKPEGGASQVEAAIVGFEDALEKGRKDHAAIARGEYLIEAREKAAAAGLRACAV